VTTPEPVEILPLTVVARSFAARPSALPDVRDFVRRQLTGTAVTDEDIRCLCDRVAAVLLEAAGVSGSIQVSLRIFPAGAEVDVLIAAGRSDQSAVSIGPPRAPGSPGPAAGPEARGPATRAGGRPDAGPARVAGPGLHRPGEGVPDRPMSPPAAEVPLSFAAWFAARLRREGLTMEAAARRLDVSAKTVSRWVGGTTEPRLRDLLRIREIFGEPPIH
jgi:hypothetical protein